MGYFNDDFDDDFNDDFNDDFDDDFDGEFSDFKAFTDFINKIREDSINKEEEIFPLPLVFKIRMAIPIDLSLILNGIMYSRIFQN